MDYSDFIDFNPTSYQSNKLHDAIHGREAELTIRVALCIISAVGIFGNGYMIILSLRRKNKPLGLNKCKNVQEDTKFFIVTMPIWNILSCLGSLIAVVLLESNLTMVKSHGACYYYGFVSLVLPYFMIVNMFFIIRSGFLVAKKQIKSTRFRIWMELLLFSLIFLIAGFGALIAVIPQKSCYEHAIFIASSIFTFALLIYVLVTSILISKRKKKLTLGNRKLVALVSTIGFLFFSLWLPHTLFALSFDFVDFGYHRSVISIIHKVVTFLYHIFAVVYPFISIRNKYELFSNPSDEEATVEMFKCDTTTNTNV